MPAFFQKHRVLLGLLTAGAVAIGLTLAVSHRTPSAPTAPDEIALGPTSPFESEDAVLRTDTMLPSPESERLVTTDDLAALSLLPKGITSIDGAGGRGVHRAVLKNGVWFPVFSPGDALRPDGTAEEASLAEIPLSITSGTPPPGQVGRPFAFGFEAIGGVPPYRWGFRLGAANAAFSMDAVSGLFAGILDVPLTTTLEVFVADAVGAEDSARYPLAIAEASALSIATAQLPEAEMAAAYATRLEATGGVPPYSWTVLGVEAAGLALTPNTGELTGTPAKAGAFTLEASVTDQAQAVSTRTLTLTVTGTGLQIVTSELPDATAGTAYSTQLMGEGGATPYTWELTQKSGAGWSLDAATGVLSGAPESAGEFIVEVQLTDARGAIATKSLQMTTINGLDITTPAPLFPGSPGLPYRLTFTATGGQEPYQWAIIDGTLPLDPAGRVWTLSADGVLSGVAGSGEGVSRFILEVRDAEDRSFSKTYELPVRQGLLAIASREKVGLAWQPEQIDRALRSAGPGLAGLVVVRGVADFPQTPGEGVLVYRGTGSNCVDRNLRTGGTYFYTLFAQTAAGSMQAFASAAATVRPMTLQRAQTGVSGDPFADRVTVFQPLTAGGFGASFVPANLTGPPDGRGTYAPASQPTEIASFHARVGAGGSVVVEFTDNIVELGPGMDFTVFENVFFVGGKATVRFMEPAIVWVALFDGQWFRFPIDVVPPAAGTPLNLRDPFYYNKGFAGRNGTTGSDPTNPTASGGDSFDADELAVPGLTWIRFIKIQSTGDQALTDDFGADPVRHTAETNALSGIGSSGFDLDAVSAVNY
jgi:hypothetical protein